MLMLTWESQAGKRYNVRSETDASATLPVNWPIWNGNTEIMATPPENTLTFPIPADPLRLFVIEQYNPPPLTAFSDDFESGQGTWTTGANPLDAGNTLWGLGTPAVAPFGPIAANSGANCFGTNIDDNYEIEANIWLRSPPIDLTGAAAATLRYFHFTDIEQTFDSGTLRILDDADDSELAVLATGIEGTTADWRQVTKNLPAAALGKTIKLEFLFQSDNIENQAGWYIDDVEVTVPAP
jgi:bacillopeptidase F